MKPAAMRVLLTGAAGGIGAEVARTLAAAGASLLLAGRDEAALQALASSLGGPARAATCVADLRDEAGLQKLATTAAAWGCNVVVHAAGRPAFGAAPQPATQLREVLETNLLAPMLLTQALLPHLQAQPAAQVLFVGSVLGSLGVPGFAGYGASKGGLRAYAQALRRELAGGPVRVQLLSPRATRTTFNDPAAIAYNRATGTAEDEPATVADAVLRLLADGAAERTLGWPERLAVRLNGAFPTLLDGAFGRHREALAARRKPAPQPRPAP